MAAEYIPSENAVPKGDPAKGKILRHSLHDRSLSSHRLRDRHMLGGHRLSHNAHVGALHPRESEILMDFPHLLKSQALKHVWFT